MNKLFIESYLESLNSAIPSVQFLTEAADIFRPVGKEEFDDGTRFYQLDHPSADMKNTRVRILDEKDGIMGKPSPWFKVENHDGKLGFKANSNDWFPIEHITYDESLSPIEIPDEVKVKEAPKAAPVSSPSKIWLWMITRNWEEVDTHTICAIYASENFPSRAFVDKLRIICNAKVATSDGHVIITSKNKVDGYPTFRFDLSELTGDYDAKKMEKELSKRHIASLYNPSEFIDFLRGYVHNINSYKLES